MVLVDTSVWVEYLRNEDNILESLLNKGHVVCHPFIIGELACGNLKNRAEILSLLRALPAAILAEHEEVLHFVENNRLIGKGLGFIDMHLLASATLSNILLLTLDKKLKHVSLTLGVAY